MEIKQENMLYKLFVWCLQLCEKATSKDLLHIYRGSTNLCHFIRVICLYAPLIIISNLLFYIMAISVIVLPFFLFKLSTVGFAVLIIIGIVAFGCGIFGLAYFLAEDILQDWFRNNEIISITSEYIKAKKEKICPYIYFKRGE